MKKLYLLCLLLFLLCAKAQSQSIIIYTAELTKGVEIPIERTDFDVKINDVEKKQVTSHNDGSLGRMPLEPGYYTVKVSSPEFESAQKDSVKINESRTTSVTILLKRKAVAPPGNMGIAK